jgi:hypothetical protein
MFDVVMRVTCEGSAWHICYDAMKKDIMSNRNSNNNHRTTIHRAFHHYLTTHELHTRLNTTSSTFTAYITCCTYNVA